MHWNQSFCRQGGKAGQVVLMPLESKVKHLRFSQYLSRRVVRRTNLTGVEAQWVQVFDNAIVTVQPSHANGSAAFVVYDGVVGISEDDRLDESDAATSACPVQSGVANAILLVKNLGGELVDGTVNLSDEAMGNL